MRSSVEETYREGVENSQNRYKGIPMLCAPGVHEAVEEKVRCYLPPGQRILDLGCGRGAFSLRLHDAGYSVDSVDMFDFCMCKDVINFYNMPVEGYLCSRTNSYDAIFLIEVLEHVEDAYRTLRQCHGALRPGGLLFLTCPNIDSSFSRTWFFLTGRHWYFEDGNVQRDGHINPIHHFQLEYILQELGMRTKEEFAAGENPTWGSWRFKALLSMLHYYERRRLRPAMQGLVRGIIAQKSS